MIVLYIPFTHDNAGDLTQRAQLWIQNHRINFSSPIELIYHKDDFNLNLIEKNCEIYILGHGNDDEDFKFLGNHSDPALATLLSLPELAKIYNEDFLAVNHFFSKIHIYICGSSKKNKELASIFQNHLMCKEQNNIYYYDGVIHLPDSTGQKWSRVEETLKPVEAMAEVIPAVEIAETDSGRGSVKKINFRLEPSDIIMRKRERFFAGNIKDRKELIHEHRHLFSFS